MDDSRLNEMTDGHGAEKQHKDNGEKMLQGPDIWKDIFNNITDIITIHDKDFNVISANKAAQNITGLPLSDMIGTKCFEIYHGKDSPPSECQSCQCLTTGKPVAFEVYEPHLNMYLEVRAMPRFDENNQLVGLIHISRDITSRKETEEILQRAEQMKLIGEWVAGLTHEIKNSLAGIKVSVELLLEELNISEENKAIILKAIHEVNQIDIIMKNLLNFAKPPAPTMMATDVNEVLDETINLSLKHASFQGESQKAIEVSRDLSTNLPRIMADPYHLQQIFISLVQNAIEAMPYGGALDVNSGYDEAKGTIHVQISDTGPGIEESVIKKIFQPFYTTKRKSTGLGLAIVKRLVEQLDGDISVESLIGKGTRFELVFPVTAKTGSNQNET